MLHKNKYALVLVDDYTRLCWVGFCKKKSQAKQLFQDFQSQHETPTCRVKRIHTDNDSVFKAGHGEDSSDAKQGELKFQHYCREQKIWLTYCCPYEHHQNGVAERMHLTLLNMTRALLKTAGKPDSYWEFAMQTACYIRNRAPNSKLQGKSPLHFKTGVQPNLSHLRVWGSPCWYKKQVKTKAPIGKTAKLSDQKVHGTLVGYPDEHAEGTYKILTNSGKVTHSYNVDFDEYTLLKECNVPAVETDMQGHDPHLHPKVDAKSDPNSDVGSGSSADASPNWILPSSSRLHGGEQTNESQVDQVGESTSNENEDDEIQSQSSKSSEDGEDTTEKEVLNEVIPTKPKTSSKGTNATLLKKGDYVKVPCDVWPDEPCDSDGWHAMVQQTSKGKVKLLFDGNFTQWFNATQATKWKLDAPHSSNLTSKQRCKLAKSS